MAILGKIGDTAKNIGGKASDKISDVAKNIGGKADETKMLNARIDSEESAIDGIYQKIGAYYYARHQSGASLPEEVAAFCAEIDACNAAIDEARTEIARVNAENAAAAAAASGSAVCVPCGYTNAPGTKFCQECGAKLETSEKRVCPCGAEAAPNVKFCGECGAKFE